MRNILKQNVRGNAGVLPVMQEETIIVRSEGPVCYQAHSANSPLLTQNEGKLGSNILLQVLTVPLQVHNLIHK